MAMQLLLTGKNIDAQRAYEVGLVNEVVPAEDLMSTALDWAKRLCRNGPLAMQTAKEIAVRSLHLESGFVLEKALGQKVLSSEDAKEGPRAFAEKRPAEFKGRFTARTPNQVGSRLRGGRRKRCLETRRSCPALRPLTRSATRVTSGSMRPLRSWIRMPDS